MKERGMEQQRMGKTRIQVCAVYESETVARIDKLAEGGKSRSLVMAELVEAGLPVLEAQKRAEEAEGR